MKKSRFLFDIILSMSLVSCGGNNSTPPEHKHTWGEATYSWTIDYSRCTASRVCLDDESHKETETVNSVYLLVRDATCTESGLETYTATFENSAFETQVNEYVLPAKDHNYRFNSFVWTGYNAKAKYVCTHDETHIVYYDAVMTCEVTTPATCENSGVKTYAATYDSHSDTKTEVLSALGHDWGEPTYERDGEEMTATRICQNDDNHIEEETVEGTYEVITKPTDITEGLGRYTFTFENPAFETQTVDVALPKVDVPKLSDDGKTITYGYYPQSYISDSGLVFALESDADWIDYGYYFYEGEYYEKVYSSPYSNSYQFDDGEVIQDKANYWFKYEPLTWKVLSVKDDEYLLVSELLLDISKYSYNNDNNYENSAIRDWLNDEFYSRAFALGNYNIVNTTVDNSAATTGSVPNNYACDDTHDNVFLLSYADYTNPNYGFDNSGTYYSSTRYCKTTDYARAKGAVISPNGGTKNNGLYWTRSPNSGNSHYAFYIRQDGFIGYDNNTSYGYLCARPAITVTIE